MFKLKSSLVILSLICALAVIAAGIVFFSVKPEKKARAGLNNELQKVLNENNIKVNDSVNAVSRPKAADNLPPITEADHSGGDLQNPVKMIIYSDFECPFCARFAKTVDDVKKAYAGKVVIAFRQHPLTFHPAALPAALASECAAEQGKFWEMHDKLFEDSRAGKLSVDEFRTDAGELGLDTEKFNQCLDSEKYRDKIEEQSAAGEKAGAAGTPTFFINGEIYPGAFPFEDFTGNDGKQHEGVKSIIERHLKQ